MHCRKPAISIFNPLAVFTIVALSTGMPSSLLAQKEQVPAETPNAPVYAALPPFAIPVIEGNAVTHQVAVVIKLELADQKDKDEFETRKPVLVDRCYRELYVLFAQHSGSVRLANEKTIKERVMRIATEILGENAVRAVLILQLVEQPAPK